MDEMTFLLDHLPSRCRVTPDRSRGFTLIELLTVIVIISLMAVLVTPAVVTLLNGTQLSRAGQMVGNNLALARQEAVKANRDVYVLFYALPDAGAPAWRGMQIAYLDRSKNPPVVKALNSLTVLPTGIEVSAEPYGPGASASGYYSPLLMRPSVSSTANVSGYRDVAWRGFRFRADGSLDRAINPALTYLTMISSKDKNVAPKNYYTVQVDPLTGMVKTFRP